MFLFPADILRFLVSYRKAGMHPIEVVLLNICDDRLIKRIFASLVFNVALYYSSLILTTRRYGASTALNYVLKHFSNPFTWIMRCYTGLEVEMIVKTMEANKSKNFYMLREMQNKILKATIKNFEVLGVVFERTDKGE